MNLASIPSLLTQLAEMLEITADALANNEEVDRLAYGPNLHVSQIQKLTADTCKSLTETLGGALTLRFLLQDRELLRIETGTTDDDIKILQHSLINQQYVTLDLILKKNTLLSDQRIEADNAITILFIFQQSFIKFLQKPSNELEAELFKDLPDDKKLIVLVPESESTLDGEHLAILGSEETDRWQSYLPKVPLKAELLSDFRSRALPQMNWSRFHLERLTPLHLCAKAVKADSNHLTQTFYQRLTELSVIYTANQVKAPSGPEKNWQAVYLGNQSTAKLVWSVPSLAEAVSGNLSHKELEALAGDIADTAAWIFEKKENVSDRLAVSRAVIARSLEDRPDNESYGRLLLQATVLRRQCRTAYDSFVQGLLDRYFKRIREVEQALDTTVKSFNDQTQTLIKGLTDNALAAVGVIVGSFLAAIFKDTFNASVFRLGLYAYAAYLALVPGLLGLTSNWGAYQQVKKGFLERVEAFKKRLSKEEVDVTIHKDFRLSIKRYQHWLRIAAGSYLLMIVLLLVGACIIPALINPGIDPAAKIGTPNVTHHLPTGPL